MDIKKICIDCDKPLPSDSDYCQYCGSSNIKTIVENKRLYCRFCGQEIPEDSVFCQYCGNKQSTKSVNRYNKRIENVLKGIGPKLLKKPIYIAALFALFIGVFTLMLLFSNANIFFSNGEIVSFNRLNYRVEFPEDMVKYGFTVEAPKDKDVYVYIRFSSRFRNDEYVSFLVKKSMTYTIYLPGGSFEAFYATGNIWLGEKRLFGLGTRYYRHNSSLNTGDILSRHYWRITFDPMDKDIIEIKSDMFPNK